jgi:hypothetical protein
LHREKSSALVEKRARFAASGATLRDSQNGADGKFCVRYWRIGPDDVLELCAVSVAGIRCTLAEFAGGWRENVLTAGTPSLLDVGMQ